MHRFSLKDFAFQDKIILKDKEILFQIKKVLRFSPWENLVLFNWSENKDYIYQITKIQKEEIHLQVKKNINKNSELNINLNLYQALPNKSSKIEYILQKATEVWFNKIVFFRSDRSQKLNISENKIKRFEKIVLEATEQSNRNTIPEIDFSNTIKFDSIIWENFILHTQKDEKSIKLKDIKLNNLENNINILIWPEWWFSEEEIQKLSKLNFKKIYLWDRILRTETTWIVVWFFISQIIC